MKIVYALMLTVLGSFPVMAQQNLWRDIAENQMFLPPAAEVALPLRHYRTVEIQLDALYQQLAAAPAEFSQQAARSPWYVQLPLPGGGVKQFRVEDSPVMHPELAARYPRIKSYKIFDEQNPRWAGRMAVSPLGVSAVFSSPDGEVFVDPYASNQSRYHVVYYQRDLLDTDETSAALRCGHREDSAEQELLAELADIRRAEQQGRGNTSAPVGLRVYDLALACTGEFGAARGGTVEAVMAVFNQTVNLVNAIFEPEVAARMQLIAMNDRLVWLNAAGDPYVNSNNGGELLGQNTDAIVQYAGIPFNSFDIGHVFTLGCTDVGGVAGGTVCSSGKARGVTCHSSTNLSAIVRRIMAHEIGHQFTASHSWNNCPGILDQLASGWAFEPGSGSTIMSYAGSCGSTNNVVFDNDSYYHAGSLFQFIGYSRFGGGNCATVTPTDNNEPEISWPYTDGFYIPIGTPFELAASATDPDGDAVTYCWEQYDLDAPGTDMGNPPLNSNAPIFRSFPPNANPNRYFPRIANVITNSSDPRELLPTYSRDLTFRLTARDNRMGGGGTVWETVAFKATATAGPFRVTTPNVGGEVWAGGEYREVTWDVANTDNALVNCKQVNIRLSVDGGFTYPYTLVSGAFNNGSTVVQVPDIPATTRARIRVEGAGNVFFDISNEDFFINPATQPAYTLSHGPIFQNLCLPATAQVAFNPGAIQGYTDPISLEVVAGLPQGATATFDNATVAPGEVATLNFDFTGINYNGLLPITVRAIGANQDTTYREVYFELVDNDYSGMALQLPPAGETGINLSTDFRWVGVPNALTYDFELATSPAFGSTVVESAEGLTGLDYSPTVLFEENSLYFWRVRPSNSCGPGDWLEPFTFHTINAICAPENAQDVPVVIPGTGPPPTRQSSLFVPFSGTISDINIPFIDVRYAPVRNLQVTLISPEGTRVRLFDENCGGTNRIFMGFDDDAPSALECPPDDGIVFRPVEALSAFAGENSFGSWILEVKVVESGFGAPGSITDWNIEFCASSTPNNPLVITNDTLFVPPAQANPITNNLLSVTDSDNSPEQLTFSVVTPPAHGALLLVDQPLNAGGQFRQSSINANNLYYQHDGGDATNDRFTFVVQDGTGGFLPVQTFHIRIDDGAIVSTQEPTPAAAGFVLSPNPASDWVRLTTLQPLEGDTQARLINVHGQVLRQRTMGQGDENWLFQTGDLPAGMYFVQLGNHTERLVLSRR